ncbi:MAG: DUF4147 domain-containing protein [Edaphobacter sp.]
MTRAPGTLREVAETIFRQSLADCSIEQAFARRVKVVAGEGRRRLLIDEVEVIDFGTVKHIWIVAAGKASEAMLEALLPHLQSLDIDLAGVLIAGELPSYVPINFQFFQGGHPLPNEASFAGARTALEISNVLQDNKASASDTLCLFLISGGASAMMELPLDPAISLADTVSFHRELVHSGASITEINCIRKHFSAVKGGRLAMASDGAACLSLLVSDVPSGNLDALSSGPTLPDTSTVEQCREILTRYNLLERFPASVRQFFENRDLPETPKPDSFTARAITLLTADDLAEAARMRAEELGFHAVIDNTCDDWDYRAAAEYLLDRLRKLKDKYPRVCLISSGEVKVELPSQGVDINKNQQFASGLGGRNQHFSLYAATLLDPSDASTVILSAGSDGIDGNSQAAGAVVEERTLKPDIDRLQGPDKANSPMKPDMRVEAQVALGRFDSYSFLDRIGSTIMTGATGNNLRDLRILLGEARP